MIRTLQIRDKKEARLTAMQGCIQSAEYRKIEFQAEYKRMLEQYQEWKKEKKIDGVLF